MPSRTAFMRRDFSIKSTQAAEAREWMQTINGPHHLTVANRGELHFKHTGIEVGHIATGYIEYSTEVVVAAKDLTQSYCIGLPLEGEQIITLGRNEFLSTPDVGVILSPNKPFQMHMSANCKKRMIRISRQALEDCLRQLLPMSLKAPLIFDPVMDLSTQSTGWLAVFQQLVPLLDSSIAVKERSVWRPLEQALIKSLLYTQPHNYQDQLLNTAQQPAYLLHLEAELKNNLMNSLSLQDIEQKAGVSRDRLYRDFQRYYGSSPVAYFRSLKLEAVRKQLLEGPASQKISALAMDYGFNQLGRFSQEYKERFNELPSQTVARAHK